MYPVDMVTSQTYLVCLLDRVINLVIDMILYLSHIQICGAIIVLSMNVVSSEVPSLSC